MKIQKSMINKNISAICFLIYFLLKPFYIFGSGSIQPGDCFLLLSFLFLVVENKRCFKIVDVEFVFFVIFVVLINFVYFARYLHNDFMKSSLYYIFNLFAVICFRYLMYDKKWLDNLVNICKVNLLIQLALFILKLVQYWYGTYRYMGTYKDPNQLGFALISTLAIIFLMNDSKKYLYFMIVAFLIIQTASFGMLAALSIMLVFDFINVIKKVLTTKTTANKVIISCIIVCFMVIVFIFHKYRINFDVFRVEQKISKSGSIIQSFIEDRNLGIITEQPYYFLFGYGEGFTFERYGYGGELHSTWISLLYYYGVIPFFILLKWIYKNIKGVQKQYIPIYLAIFLEAFTLINHRQPSFWMIIMLGTILRSGEKNGKENTSSYKCYRTSV